MNNTINFPVEEVQCQTESGIKIPFKAIVRPDTKQVLGTVGADYKLMRHADVFGTIEKDLGLTDVAPKHTVCKGGAVVFARYDAPQLGMFESRKGDLVNFKIDIFNSYDGSLAVGFRIIGERLACSNGMVVAGTIAKAEFKHTANAQIESLRDKFNEKKEQLNLVKSRWSIWAKTHCKDEKIEAFNDQYLNDSLGEQVESIYQSNYAPNLGPNVWSYFNALTHYSTHILKAQKNNRSNDGLRRFYFEKNIVENFYKFNWN